MVLDVEAKLLRGLAGAPVRRSGLVAAAQVLCAAERGKAARLGLGVAALGRMGCRGLRGLLIGRRGI